MTTAMTDLAWRREAPTGTFLVSTSPTLLDYNFINTAFGTEDMPWATSLPFADIATLLSNSLTLGLYKTTPAVPLPSTASAPSTPRTPSPTLEAPLEDGVQQIGLARLITDRVSTAYLTDVYVLPKYRGEGNFKWLIACVEEVLKAHTALRRVLLAASVPGAGVESYKKQLGLWDVQEERGRVVLMTRRGQQQTP